MKRDILEKIKEWDSSGSRRKPLIMIGARQVGKTWLLKAFAAERLDEAGMIHQVHRVSRPGMPLKAYADFSAFKLYAHDVGLLAAMSDIPLYMIGKVIHDYLGR